MWLFDVGKSQRVPGRRPRQEMNSCKMGRNSVHPSVHPSIRPSVHPPLAGSQTLLAGSQTLLAGLHTLLAGPLTPPAGPQTPPAVPKTLRASWRGLRAGWRSLRASHKNLKVSQQGLRASQRGADVQTDVWTGGHMYRISPHSTGLHPLSKPLLIKQGKGTADFVMPLGRRKHDLFF